MQGAARIAFPITWIALCLGLGVFGGFAGEYIVGLPLTILLPFLPVRLARFQGVGTPALIAYGVGVLLAVAWTMGNSFIIDSTPHWPAGGTIAVSIVLVIFAALMFYAALRRPEVRNRLP